MTDTPVHSRSSSGPARRFRDRIRQLERFNAFVSLTDEDGSGPMVAVKDVIDVKGAVTTGGSDLLPDVPAQRDALVVAALRDAGCAVIGKTNLHEWAFGPTSINPFFGAVHNPRDFARVAGGSSGGSATAVALRMCDWAIGTDTGGSVRISAALCGVTGFRPTANTLPTEGIVPLSPSLDTAGPMAADVRSVITALEAMRAAPLDVKEVPLRDLQVAVPDTWVRELDTETERAWRRAASGFSRIPFPPRNVLADTGRTVLYAEAAVVHRERFRLHAHRYSPDVRRHLEEAQRITEGDYEAAKRRLGDLRGQVTDAMAGWDAIVLPTTACVAPRIDAVTSGGKLQDLREPISRFTMPFSATGHPAITLPVPGDGMPVGLQVVGHFGHDAHVASVALALERVMGTTVI
ncbi:amidase [Streptomyces sp. OE57]|uniref:amidase n=1 Tax=Streptomyces lacaronensis TaxID=3379885 RepID=UPI0039B75AC2